MLWSLAWFDIWRVARLWVSDRRSGTANLWEPLRVMHAQRQCLSCRGGPHLPFSAYNRFWCPFHLIFLLPRRAVCSVEAKLCDASYVCQRNSRKRWARQQSISNWAYSYFQTWVSRVRTRLSSMSGTSLLGQNATIVALFSQLSRPCRRISLCLFSASNSSSRICFWWICIHRLALNKITKINFPFGSFRVIPSSLSLAPCLYIKLPSP